MSEAEQFYLDANELMNNDQYKDALEVNVSNFKHRTVEKSLERVDERHERFWTVWDGTVRS